MVRKTALILLIVLTPGCRSARTEADPQVLESRPVELLDSDRSAAVRPISVSREVSAVSVELSGPLSLETVVAECLRQSSGVQALRKRVDAGVRRVTVAGSLQDPMLELDNWPTAARSPQYASGRMTNELMVSQQVPWFGKRGSQACAAQAEVQGLRAELSALELEITEEARRAWYELYYTQLMLGVVREDRQVLENLLTVAEARYETGEAGQQEVLRLLAEIQREQHLVDRARLDYYPDVTMRMGWGRMTTEGSMAHGADGVDNVSVGFGVNVPVNRGRLRASVHAAEASAVAAARDYDRLKSETQRDVKQLFSQAISQRDSSELLRDSVIPKTEQALRAAVRGYQVGATDFSDVIATWRELLKFHVSQLQLELQYRQTLASLERVVGGGSVVAESDVDEAAVDAASEGEEAAPEDRVLPGATEVRGVSMLSVLKQNYRRGE